MSIRGEAYARPVTTVQWLLMLHVSAAFFFVGGSVAAAILNTLAVRAERPSEAAALLRLVRVTLPIIGLGVAGTLVFGIWLWHELDFPLDAWWIWASLVLWVIANALGGIGGRHQERSRKLAEQLAGRGRHVHRRAARAAPRPEGERDLLARRARDPRHPRPDDLEAGRVVLLAYSRPFWPLFLHVLGAMTLFGAVLAAVILSGAAWRTPDRAFLRKATFWALVSGIPACIVLRVGAQWIYSKEGFSGQNDPTWIGIGFGVSDARAPAPARRDRLRLLVDPQRPAARRPDRGRDLAPLYLVAARRRLARDVREMGLTKRLPQGGETPRKRGIGSPQ